jgi:hypothetical protein
MRGWASKPVAGSNCAQPLEDMPGRLSRYDLDYDADNQTLIYVLRHPASAPASPGFWPI